MKLIIFIVTAWTSTIIRLFKLQIDHLIYVVSKNECKDDSHTHNHWSISKCLKDFYKMTETVRISWKKRVKCIQWYARQSDVLQILGDLLSLVVDTRCFLCENLIITPIKKTKVNNYENTIGIKPGSKIFLHVYFPWLLLYLLWLIVII